MDETVAGAAGREATSLPWQKAFEAGPVGLVGLYGIRRFRLTDVSLRLGEVRREGIGRGEGGEVGQSSVYIGNQFQ